MRPTTIAGASPAPRHHRDARARHARALSGRAPLARALIAALACATTLAAPSLAAVALGSSSQPAPASGAQPGRNEPVIDIPGIARTPRPGQVLPTPPTPTPTTPTPTTPTRPAPAATPPATPAPPLGSPSAPAAPSPARSPLPTQPAAARPTETPAIGISQGPIFLPPPRIEPPPAGSTPGGAAEGSLGLVRSLEGSFLLSDVRPLSPALAPRTVRGRLEPTILRVDSVRGGGVQLRRVAGDRAEPWQLAQDGQELSGDFELRTGPTTEATISVAPAARLRVGPLTRARVLRLNDPDSGGVAAVVQVHRGVVERLSGEALLVTPAGIFDTAQARTVVHDPAGGTRVGGSR